MAAPYASSREAIVSLMPSLSQTERIMASRWLERLDERCLTASDARTRDRYAELMRLQIEVLGALEGRFRSSPPEGKLLALEMFQLDRIRAMRGSRRPAAPGSGPLHVELASPALWASGGEALGVEEAAPPGQAVRGIGREPGRSSPGRGAQKHVYPSTSSAAAPYSPGSPSSRLSSLLLREMASREGDALPRRVNTSVYIGDSRVEGESGRVDAEAGKSRLSAPGSRAGSRTEGGSPGQAGQPAGKRAGSQTRRDSPQGTGKSLRGRDGVVAQSGHVPGRPAAGRLSPTGDAVMSPLASPDASQLQSLLDSIDSLVLAASGSASAVFGEAEGSGALRGSGRPDSPAGPGHSKGGSLTPEDLADLEDSEIAPVMITTQPSTSGHNIVVQEIDEEVRRSAAGSPSPSGYPGAARRAGREGDERGEWSAGAGADRRSGCGDCGGNAGEDDDITMASLQTGHSVHPRPDSGRARRARPDSPQGKRPGAPASPSPNPSTSQSVSSSSHFPAHKVSRRRKLFTPPDHSEIDVVRGAAVRARGSRSTEDEAPEYQQFPWHSESLGRSISSEREKLVGTQERLGGRDGQMLNYADSGDYGAGAPSHGPARDLVPNEVSYDRPSESNCLVVEDQCLAITIPTRDALSRKRYYMPDSDLELGEFSGDEEVRGGVGGADVLGGLEDPDGPDGPEAPAPNSGERAAWEELSSVIGGKRARLADAVVSSGLRNATF